MDLKWFDFILTESTQFFWLEFLDGLNNVRIKGFLTFH